MTPPFVCCGKHAWEATEERKAAIHHAILTIAVSSPDCTLQNCAEVFRAMLEEAGK